MYSREGINKRTERLFVCISRKKSSHVQNRRERMSIKEGEDDAKGGEKRKERKKKQAYCKRMEGEPLFFFFFIGTLLLFFLGCKEGVSNKRNNRNREREREKTVKAACRAICCKEE